MTMEKGERGVDEDEKGGRRANSSTRSGFKLSQWGPVIWCYCLALSTLDNHPHQPIWVFTLIYNII